MLANLNDVLVHAKQNKYAVGLFNTVNLEMAKGVITAAEDCHSPVIIGTAEVLLPYSTLQELAYFLIPMAKKATVPVVVHFDHGLTKEAIYHAIDLGFSSIMYDCSSLSYDKNCSEVAAMISFAHSRGVSVEAELGHVGANPDAAEGSVEKGIYTDPLQAVDFAEKTGADALAIAIGTAHGAYKSIPKLDFDRLSEISTRVSTPLVLHGGSGLTVTDFKRAIEHGICKVNIFTDINNAAAKAAHDGYKEGRGMTDLMGGIVAAIKKTTMDKMGIFGSSGRV